MAKWGEGDPRWIVEHRDDGKNVGGWHWVSAVAALAAGMACHAHVVTVLCTHPEQRSPAASSGLLAPQSEVNKMEWTKKRLGELLPGTEARLESPGPFAARVTAVRSVSGEVGAGPNRRRSC